MNFQRDVRVIGLALKGKAKVPTVTLSSFDGEKLTLKFSDPSILGKFSINQEFTLKVTEGEQVPLLSSKKSGEEQLVES